MKGPAHIVRDRVNQPGFSFLDTSSTYLCAELTLDVFFAHSAIILVSSPELMKLLKVVHVCPDF